MKNGTGIPTAPEKIEVKYIKHIFTTEEQNQLGADLARAIGGLRGINAEFDQVKAGFKARLTEAEAKIDNLSTARMNGFEMRNERCVVVFMPNDRKKEYIREEDYAKFGADADAALVEDMNADDFQQELIQAESKFEHREEIELFPATESDRGILVVGRFAGKWFSALRVKIGKLELNERLDSEQPCSKERTDAVKRGITQARDWAKQNLKEHAKGFEDSFNAAAEAHKERAE